MRIRRGRWGKIMTNLNEPKKIAVIGAGAAGLMAAGFAAGKGTVVTVFEKGRRSGQKLLITGKGRCNLTNACDLDTFMANVPGNGKFMYSAYSHFSSDQLQRFFEEQGVPLKVERGNRVFPVSDRASDVVKALTHFAETAGAKVHFHSTVKKLIVEDAHIKGLQFSDGHTEAFDAVIVATGGLSYPDTGSTGDGYRFAEETGHKVVPPQPSLVPLETVEKWVSEASGLTLKNIRATFTNKKGKKVYEEFGDLLITHFGVSGPVILSASRHLLKDGFSNITLHIDLKPALDMQTLDARIQRDVKSAPNKSFKNTLSGLLPPGLIPVIIENTGIPADKAVNGLTREDRLNLCKQLKDLTLSIKRARPIDEAIVTAGGVSIKDVNPATMASKWVKGLYFAGEVLDVDGYTGGFNLTIAFATGHCAGIAAATVETEEKEGYKDA